MHNFARLTIVSITSIWLAGCSFSEDSTDTSGQPLSDATQSNVATQTDVSVSDQNNFQVSGSLADDILIAPPEPLLSIQAAPGALNFIWEDRNNNAQTAVARISLFEYNFRTDVETQIDTSIDTTSTQYTHQVTSHQLAWDSISYRVELCTTDDCLSSMRVPISGLLSNAVTPITPVNAQLSNSFGDNVALNATGNVAVVTSPAQASAVVLFQIANQWIEASTLTSINFADQTGATLRVALSASGDTIAIASIADNSGPTVSVFDRLGENWFETSSLAVSSSNIQTQNWFTDSLFIDLSDDGDRLAVAAQSEVNPNNNVLVNNNNVMIFERGNSNWVTTAALTVPTQHTRIAAFSTSANLERAFVLSALSGSLYLNEFALTANGWGTAEPEFIGSISPTADNIVLSSGNASEIVIAGWEVESNSSRSAVAWRFNNLAGSWVANDSVKLPPTNATNASLRLAADAQLSSIAIGWQALNSANLAFYAQDQQRWQNLFSVPEAFNLNQNVPLAQSVAISADNSTALIGTSNSGNGGLVSAFR